MNANPFERRSEVFEESVESRKSLLAQLSDLRPKQAELMRILEAADKQYEGKTLSDRETQARVRAQNLLLSEVQILAEQIDAIESKLTELTALSAAEDSANNPRDLWSDPSHRGGNNRAANA